jgi:sulfate adenylyltransferase subunit 1
MDILRFITVGSVDDGKSTLIGRLLYDSKSILQDQLEAIERSSKKKGNEILDLSLLTDGLRAEREQGITIDIAYKYFTTPKRKFIIADAPGHVQYTRNMVTGASNSDLAIILIDSRKGVIEQTRRHLYICSLLGISHIAVCINKMDLVEYSQSIYNEIVADCQNFIKDLHFQNVTFIPISALAGDNIVDKSTHTPWYSGKCLFEHLETVPLHSTVNLSQARFPVQYVIRPQLPEYHDYRGYAGRVVSGVYKKGDAITVLPSGFQSKIKAIEKDGGTEIAEAFAPMSVVIHLQDEIDISRGDVLIKSEEKQPEVSKELEVDVCWLDTKHMDVREKYWLMKNGQLVKCLVKEVVYKVDVNTQEKDHETKRLHLNDIARIRLQTASPVVFDDYQTNRSNGCFILVDIQSNLTVAACMIAKKEEVKEAFDFDF